MKKLLTIILVISSLTSYSQDKRFSTYMSVDPYATYKDGFNIGLGIEYQMTLMYFKAESCRR